MADEKENGKQLQATIDTNISIKAEICETNEFLAGSKNTLVTKLSKPKQDLQTSRYEG